ncbi:MAG: ABC transporter permease [Opitutae bacterium]|nr:ABC transporter permease [Opitutae bacterium]
MNPLRPLLKSPRYALLAIAIIALGTGSCTAVFSLFESLMLKPRAGLVDESRLADIGLTRKGSGFDNFSYPDFEDYRAQNSTFTDIAAVAFATRPAGLSVADDAQPANLQWVSANFFSVLGARFASGRGFAGTTGEAAVVLSHNYWQRRFQSDPAAVGRSVILNGQPVAIIGVTEPGFHGATVVAADLWVPYSFNAVLHPGSQLTINRENTILMGIGRLKPGVTLAQAQGDLSLIAARNAAAYPLSHQDHGVAVARSSRFPGEIGLAAGAFLGILGLLALLALLVASANIAGLMLARGAARQREFAVRSALGADRARLVRALLAEHLTLFVIGGAAGSLVCLWLVDALRGLVPVLPVSVAVDVTVNPAAFAFILGLSLLVGLVFGLGPALSSSRFDLLAVLRRGERPAGGSRLFSLRSFFLVIQLTLSLALLTTAATLARSLWQLAYRDPGFDSRRVEFVQFDLRTAGLTDKTGPLFLAQLLSAAQRLPTLSHAAFTAVVPLEGGGKSFGDLRKPTDSKDEPAPRLDWNLVSPDYFATLGIPLVKGRGFTAADRDGAPLVGIVNETMAARYWPGENAVGKILLNSDGKPVEIVGVARNAKYRSAGEAPRPHFYAPSAQLYDSRTTLFAKSLTGASVVPQLRALVAKLQPALPVHHAQSLSDSIAASQVPQRVAAGAALGTGALALLLAGMGVYGVTLFWTTTRAREFGVRLALGAAPRSLLVLALSGSLRLAAIATVFGLAAAFGLTLLVNSLFGGIDASPLVFGGAAALFAGLVALAAFLPARRAARVDPMIALRAE